MGGYNFSLMDDDDEDNLQADALQDPTLRAISIAGAGRAPATKPAQPWAPQVVEADPMRKARWDDAEAIALSRSQYDPNDYGVGEFARDNSGLLISGVLDAAFNKGRGLPTLADASFKQNAQNEAQRRSYAKEQGDFAQKIHGQKSTDLSDQARVRSLQLQEMGQAQQQQRIDQAAAAESRRGVAQSAELDPNDPNVQAVKQALVAKGVDPETLDGVNMKGLQRLTHQYNLDTDLAATPAVARSKATIAGAQEGATKNVDLRMNPQIAAATETATAPIQIDKAGKTSTATTTARLDAERPDKQRKEGEDFQTHFAEKNDKLLTVRQLLGDVVGGAPDGGMPEGLDDKSQLASKIPFGSRMNSAGANDTIRKVNAAISQTVYKDSGASASLQEAANHASAVINGISSSPEEKWSAIQEFTQQMDDEIASKSTRPGDASAVLQRRGIKPLKGRAQPAPGDLPSLAGGDDEVPAPAPMAPPSGGVRMRSPSGNTGMVPTNKVQAALQKGWTQL